MRLRRDSRSDSVDSVVWSIGSSIMTSWRPRSCIRLEPKCPVKTGPATGLVEVADLWSFAGVR